jgi:hypothetical protein
MRFIRRKLIHSALVACVALAGYGITTYETPDGETHSIPSVARAQSEFARVANALKGGSGRKAAQDSRTKKADTPVAADNFGPAEPKVFEIEYDDEGNAVGPGTVMDQSIELDESALEGKGPRRIVRASGPGTHQDAAYHFSLTLPLGWSVMSAQELKLINRGARSFGFGSKVQYQTGFRRKNTKPGSSPYILVAAKPGRLSSYAEVEDALENEMPKATKKAEGALSKVASNLSISTPTLDRSTNRIQFNSQVDVNGIGTMQAMSVGHIGSEGVIFVHCYALDRDFGAWATTFDRINDSFCFDEGYEFKEGVHSGWLSQAESMFRSGRGIGMLLGGAGGAVAGLVALALRKPRRVRHQPIELSDVTQLDPHAASLVEQHRLKADTVEAQVPRFDEVPAPKPASALGAVSQTLSWVLPIAILSFAGWWCYKHGPAAAEKVPELKRTVAEWWIEQITKQAPDEMYSDAVARVREVGKSQKQ